MWIMHKGSVLRARVDLVQELPDRQIHRPGTAGDVQVVRFVCACAWEVAQELRWHVRWDVRRLPSWTIHGYNHEVERGVHALPEGHGSKLSEQNVVWRMRCRKISGRNGYAYVQVVRGVPSRQVAQGLW